MDKILEEKLAKRLDFPWQVWYTSCVGQVPRKGRTMERQNIDIIGPTSGVRVWTEIEDDLTVYAIEVAGEETKTVRLTQGEMDALKEWYDKVRLG